MAAKPFNLHTLQELSFVRAKQWGEVLQKFESKEEEEEQALNWSDMSAVFEGEEENDDDGGDANNEAEEAEESDGAEEASILKDVTNISNVLKNFSVLPSNSTQLQGAGADGAAHDSYHEDQEMRDLLDNTIPVLQEHKRRMRESGIDRVLSTFDPAKVEEKVGGWLRRQYAGVVTEAATSRWPRLAHHPHAHVPLDEAHHRVAYHSGSENDSSHSVDTVRYIRSSRPKPPAGHRKHAPGSGMTIKTYRMVKSKRDNLRQKYTVLVGAAAAEEEEVLSAHRRCASHRKLVVAPKCPDMGLASGSHAIVKRAPQRSKVLRKRRSHEHQRDLAYYLSSSCYSSDEEPIDGGGCACCLPRRPPKPPKVKHRSLRPVCSCCPPTRQVTRTCQSLCYRRSRGRVCFTTSFTSSESTSFVETACGGQKKCCSALSAKDARSWKRESECSCRTEELLCNGVRHLTETSTDSWLVENYESPRRHPVEKTPKQRRSKERYCDTPRSSQPVPQVKELSPVLMENWLAALQTQSLKAKVQAKEQSQRNSIGKQQQQHLQLQKQQQQQPPLPLQQQQQPPLLLQQQQQLPLPLQQQTQLPLQQQQHTQEPLQQQQKPQQHTQQQEQLQEPLQQQKQIQLTATPSTQSDKGKGKKPKANKGETGGKMAKKSKANAAKEMASDMNAIPAEPEEVLPNRKPSKETKSSKASKKQTTKAVENSGDQEDVPLATESLPKEVEEPQEVRSVTVDELTVGTEDPVEPHTNTDKEEGAKDNDNKALQKEKKQRERKQKVTAANRQEADKAKTQPDSTGPEEKAPQDDPMASCDDDEKFMRNLQKAIELSRKTFEKEVKKPKEKSKTAPSEPPIQEPPKTTDTSSVCDESSMDSRKIRSLHQLTMWLENENEPSEAESRALKEARVLRSRIPDTPSSTSSLCVDTMEMSLKPQPRSVKQRRLARRMQASCSNSSMEDSAFMASGGRVYNSTAIGDMDGGTAEEAKSFANSTEIPGVTRSTRLARKPGPKSKVRRRIPSPIPESLESTVVSSATDCAVVSSTTGAEPIRTQKGILLYTPQNRDYAPEETIRNGYFHVTEDCLKRVIGERTAGNFFKYHFGQKKFDCNRSRVYFRPPDTQTVSESESDVDVFERMGRYGELVVSMDEDSNADE